MWAAEDDNGSALHQVWDLNKKLIKPTAELWTETVGLLGNANAAYAVAIGSL